MIAFFAAAVLLSGFDLADHERPRLVRQAEVASALAAELRLMAGWLGLDRVEVEPRGDLAPTLLACDGMSAGVLGALALAAEHDIARPGRA